ncbi:hypothetical protein PAPYR_9255 [Paratrimastix pyriformis]|uniref:non-specific serine/threonine protein kinase n=1 Tax=Paratrimastix pyriformis TaxID=342808 RepID=A0ABQ8U8W4_9EUKA|nr:hypothetical protein PAPYR_9255 [Paratrimastix pyriformis]
MLKANVVLFRFKGTTSDDIPLVNCGDVVFVSEEDKDVRPFVVTLKTPPVQGNMPRMYLKELPEPRASQCLAEFEASLAGGPPVPSAQPSSGGSASAAPAATPGPGGQTPLAAPTPAAPAVSPSQPPLYRALLFSVSGPAPLMGVAERLKRGEERLTLFEAVAEYRHKPPPGAPAAELQLRDPEGRRLTQSYTILGAGAFGITFRCEEPRDAAHRDVALKVTGPPQSELERNFFHNEGYITAAINHPNVMRAAGPSFEAQLEPGGPMLRCLVTPFCECGDLDALIRRHLREPSADPAADRAERWGVLVDLVRGLAYLHERPFQPDNDHRVLHNDIKPANVLLRRDKTTGRLTALLADLGLACVYTGGSLSFGLCRGTPGFMAPELCAATAEAQALLDSGMRTGNTPASDVYAMGVTLYCMYSQTDTAHRTEELPLADELQAAFAEVAARGPEGRLVADMLVRMCSPDPTARPSMGRLLEAVEAAERARNPDRTRQQAPLGSPMTPVPAPVPTPVAASAPTPAPAPSPVPAPAPTRPPPEPERGPNRAEGVALLEPSLAKCEVQPRPDPEAPPPRLPPVAPDPPRPVGPEVPPEDSLSRSERAVLQQARDTPGAELALHYKGLSDRFAILLAAWLRANRTVTTLGLARNKIKDPGGRAIGAALLENATLQLARRAPHTPAPSHPLVHTRTTQVSPSTVAGRSSFPHLAPTPRPRPRPRPRPSLIPPLALQRVVSCVQLSVRSNSMGAEGACAIVAALAYNHTLTSIDLGDISAGDEIARMMGAVLERNGSLLRVSIGQAKMGPEGATALAAGLERNYTLTALDLRENAIGDGGAAALAGAFQRNPHLPIRELDLRSNKITDAGGSPLKDWVVCCTTLRTPAFFARLLTLGAPLGRSGCAGRVQLNLDGNKMDRVAMALLRMRNHAGPLMISCEGNPIRLVEMGYMDRSGNVTRRH